MLSAETAVGQYPVEAVAMMDRIARRVQADPLYFATLDASRMPPEHTNHDAISAAACQVAETVGAAAIVSFTSSGATALRAARERPGVPILALTPNLATARRLSRGDRPLGRTRRHHRRRPLRHPRLNQRPAHRLDRPISAEQRRPHRGRGRGPPPMAKWGVAG